MMKFFFFFSVLSVVIIDAVSAQKDTSIYYLTNSGKVVSTKDSADFFLLILPPDTSVDKSLFVVKEYYSNGKIRLWGNSSTKTLQSLKFEGSQVIYFRDGHKMRITNFKNGEPSGDLIEYYPNGKLYNIKNYKGKTMFLKQYNDSTGIILAENGKGKWKEYNNDFRTINVEGDIINGVQDGIWTGRVADSVDVQYVYNKGKLISNSRIYKYKSNAVVSTSVDIIPEFPGGIEAFGRYLAKNIRYPARAFENHTQGRVIITFVVEKDGALSNVKVARGIGDGCDEEALRVISDSPPWRPGSQNGKPVRVAYTVPVAFTLTR